MFTCIFLGHEERLLEVSKVCFPEFFTYIFPSSTKIRMVRLWLVYKFDKVLVEKILFLSTKIGKYWRSVCAQGKAMSLAGWQHIKDYLSISMYKQHKKKEK